MDRKVILHAMRKLAENGIQDTPLGLSQEEKETLATATAQSSVAKGKRAPVPPSEHEERPQQKLTAWDQDLLGQLKSVIHSGQPYSKIIAAVNAIFTDPNAENSPLLQKLRPTLSEGALSALGAATMTIRLNQGSQQTLKGLEVLDAILSDPSIKVSIDAAGSSQAAAALVNIGRAFGNDTVTPSSSFRATNMETETGNVPDALRLIPESLWPDRFKTVNPKEYGSWGEILQKDKLISPSEQAKGVKPSTKKPKGKGLNFDWLKNLFNRKKKNSVVPPTDQPNAQQTDNVADREIFSNVIFRRYLLTKLAADKEERAAGTSRSFDPMTVAESIFKLIRTSLRLDKAPEYKVRDLNQGGDASFTNSTNLTPIRSADGYDFHLRLDNLPADRSNIGKLAGLKEKLNEKLSSYGTGKLEFAIPQPGSIEIWLTVPRPKGGTPKGAETMSEAARSLESQEMPSEMSSGGDRSSSGELRNRVFRNKQWNALIKLGVNDFVTNMQSIIKTLQEYMKKQVSARKIVDEAETRTTGTTPTKELEEAQALLRYPYGAMKQSLELLVQLKNWILTVVRNDKEGTHIEEEIKAVTEFLNTKFRGAKSDAMIDIAANPEEAMNMLVNKFKNSGVQTDASTLLSNSFISPDFSAWEQTKKDIGKKQKEIDFNGKKMTWDDAAELLLAETTKAKEPGIASSSLSANWNAKESNRLERKALEVDEVIDKVTLTLERLTNGIQMISQEQGNIQPILDKVKQSATNDPVVMQAISKIEQKQAISAAEQQAIYKATTGASVSGIVDKLTAFPADAFQSIFGTSKRAIELALQQNGLTEQFISTLNTHADAFLNDVKEKIAAMQSTVANPQGASINVGAIIPFEELFGQMYGRRSFDIVGDPEKTYFNLVSMFNKLQYDSKELITELTQAVGQTTTFKAQGGVLTPDEVNMILSRASTSAASESVLQDTKELQTTLAELQEVRGEISKWLSQNRGKEGDLVVAVSSFLDGLYKTIEHITHRGTSTIMKYQVFPDDTTPEILTKFEELNNFVTQLESKKAEVAFRKLLLTNLEA